MSGLMRPAGQRYFLVEYKLLHGFQYNKVKH